VAARSALIGPDTGHKGSMIERIAEMPAGTVGFRVAGEVEREDYRDVVMPELRRALDVGGGLRTLYLIEDLDEVEPGALWADAKLGFDLGVRHHGDWVRSAIVTNLDWMAAGNPTVRLDDPRRSAHIRDRRARVREAVGGR
jgi:hypothetical protein